jgi:hypothetical protein
VVQLSSHFCEPARRLPNLEDLECKENSFATRSESLHALLRQTAIEYRTSYAQSFYSVRAVARHFHIPPATVSRVYRKLSSERLLRVVWGAQTLLEPINSTAKRHRRIIGLPVDIYRFTTSAHYRNSILNLQREIGRHCMMERFFFFEKPSEDVLGLKRQNFSDIDFLIWFSPNPSDKQALFRLYDIGLRVICIGDMPICWIREYYTMSRRRTIGAVLRKETQES